MRRAKLHVWHGKSMPIQRKEPEKSARLTASSVFCPPRSFWGLLAECASRAPEPRATNSEATDPDPL